MHYKVCVLAAGKNERVSYAKDFNISLLPIGERSTLSKIIEKFPKTVEIIIAVGYNKNLVKDFIEIAYKDRRITLVEVENYSGPGSGPGYSLLECKQHLQCPFIFTSADTIVSEEVPEPNRNWIGVSQVSDSTNYCMAEVENNRVIKFYDKVDTPTLMKICKNYKTILNNAFIGMAGISDYKIFWTGLERDPHLIQKELQVSNGLSELINRRIESIPFFNWFDTGNEAGYNYASRFFGGNKILTKPNEFIYFENGNVIKYFADENNIIERIQRAEVLKEIVPKIIYRTPNFYAYEYVEGETLSQINDVAIFKHFLQFCKRTIWRRKILDGYESSEFKQLCRKFYYDKTIERLEKFYRENGIIDQAEIINGEKVPAIAEMLKKIDWETLSNGIPVIFHGDLQPENIIVSENGFKLIDWRANFAGKIEYGDIYYDFCKLHHALIITHEVIRNNQFEVKTEGDSINYDFMLKSNLTEYKDIFEKFIVEEGYDLGKVKILSSLTFLNIAPLHHNPYNHFLYYLGKYNLFKELQNQNKTKLTQDKVMGIIRHDNSEY